MLYHRYLAPLHIRVCRDILWYARFFIKNILPEIGTGLAFAIMFILPPIMAAFVV